MAAEIKYIVQLYRKSSLSPNIAIGASIGNQGRIISAIETGIPEQETYWSQWGGWYDTPTFPEIIIFLGKYLRRVPSLNALIKAEESYTVEGKYVYLNTPKYPWQYWRDEGSIEVQEAYASTVSDSRKPSDDTYANELNQRQRYPTLLKIPQSTLNVSLSDPVNGVVLFPTFSFELENADGRFDSYLIKDFANRPTYMLKTNIERPRLSNFNVIRKGSIENIKTTLHEMRLTASDPYRTLSEEVCRPYTQDVFASLPPELVGEKMPAAWGTINDAPKIDMGNNRYALCDPVYEPDVNDDSITKGTDFIFSPKGQDETISFTSSAPRKIGPIITSVIERISNIPYVEGLWDVGETDRYAAICSEVGIYYAGGQVRHLVGEILKNDLAFLFTKNDGRLTIRRWGETYQTHEIPAWQITHPPVRENSDAKYYLSSCIIDYLHQQESDTYQGRYFDNSQESDIYLRWRKRVTKTFKTRLCCESDAIDLAARILHRFGRQANMIKLTTGFDTSQVNLLDRVVTDVNINGRQLTSGRNFIVREVNPAQDILLLEETDGG